MAALNRRNLNLDDFVGLNWSCWADVVNYLPSDDGSDSDDSSGCGKNHSETMTLRKEDMHIYGHCPAHDDFYLVVCNQCGQVVKPEAFEEHCGRRHVPPTKMCGQSSASAPQQRPRPGQPPSDVSSSKEKQKKSRSQDVAPSKAASPVLQRRLSKVQKEAVSLPSEEMFPQDNHPLPSRCSSVPRPRVPLWHSGPLPPGHSSSSPPPTAGKSSESSTPLRGMRTYSRIYKNVDKKECGLNKHCRILDPVRKKPDSRELICKTDTVHQQPKALGRAKVLDQFAAEQRITTADRDVEQLFVKLKDKEQHLDTYEEQITQGSRYNCHILRSGDPQESFPEEEGDSTVEVEVQPPYPFNQSLLSSEESEVEEQEEATDLPASPWHPKPLGLCTFGCRPLGCSIFTFDRRLHHLRFALSAMLEQHVSTHLLKKMPQVSSGLRSCHVTTPTVRTATRPYRSTGSLSLESTSLETKSSQHNSQSTKPPSSTSSTYHGPGRWCNTTGRTSKAQPKEVVVMQKASTAQKASRLLYNGSDKSSRCIRDHPLHEKRQPQIPCEGPSSTFSHGKKPCPPLPPQTSERQLPGLEKTSPLPTTMGRSPRSRGRSQVIRQKRVGHDNKGCGQKRKGSNESPPLNSSLAKSSKCKRLSTASRSSLLTWKGENIGDVFSWSLDKSSNS